MFERCTESARRAIFYARASTILMGDPEISTQHVLAGVLWEDASRVCALFPLRESFPMYLSYPWVVADPDEVLVAANNPPLTDSSKRVLAWSVQEAGRLGDYWIDSEHLLLGILCERSCPAAKHLELTGLTLETARKTIQENKHSRPNYGTIPVSWLIRTQPLQLISRWVKAVRK
jgi:ATP-dependent Clp protease ATP-binding subunit ClpC